MVNSASISLMLFKYSGEYKERTWFEIRLKSDRKISLTHTNVLENSAAAAMDIGQWSGRRPLDSCFVLLDANTKNSFSYLGYAHYLTTSKSFNVCSFLFEYINMFAKATHHPRIYLFFEMHI